MTADLQFAARGHRRKAGYGLTYRSRCGRFVVYKSCQCDGIALPVRWLALRVLDTGAERLISRHKTRAAAERACRRVARRLEER